MTTHVHQVLGGRLRHQLVLGLLQRQYITLERKQIWAVRNCKKTLQDEQKCQIHYDTVWKGRQIALRELYGNWEESFQLLFNWRAEVLKKSPGSVIEIGIKKVDSMFYFHRFFCALQP